MDLSLRTNFAQEEAWEAHARCGDEILNVHQMDEERYDDPEEEYDVIVAGGGTAGAIAALVAAGIKALEAKNVWHDL